MILDTHIFIWLVNGDKLPGPISDRILTASRLAISAISAWEIFMLEKHKKLTFNIASAAWLGRATALHNIETINPGVSVFHRANRLDWQNLDPADRFIVATALETGLPLATADKTILNSGLVECV